MDELSFIIFLVIFITFFSLLEYLGMPSAYMIFTAADLGLMFGELALVTGTCVLATGIPCTVAVIGTIVANFFVWFIASQDWIKLFIFTPLMLITYYIIMRLARGI